MRTLVSRLTAAASHLALWASLYVTGAVVCFSQLSQGAAWTRMRWLSLAYAFVTAATVYLLDRVKLRDRWLDPADREAHPERFGFMERHSGAVRALAAVLGAASVWLGWVLSPVGPVLTLGACVGVVAYAGWPRKRRARIKDVFLVKNGFVAAGITVFAGLVMVMGDGLGRSPADVRELVMTRWPVLAYAGVQVFLRVFADAAVCDLDDEHADRSYRTATLPTHLGRFVAWNVATGIRISLGMALLAIPLGPTASRVAWGGLTIGSTLALRWWNPARVREPVDGRLAVEALAASLIELAIRAF